MFYLVVHDGLTFTAIRALCRAFLNTIGLFILVAFLGYGLVEVPRNLWNKGDTLGQLRYLQFKVLARGAPLCDCTGCAPSHTVESSWTLSCRASSRT